VLFSKLSGKLNALSSFHYTPAAFVKEMEVRPAIPAIAMEEVCYSITTNKEYFSVINNFIGTSDAVSDCKLMSSRRGL